MRVLLADDSELILERLQQMLGIFEHVDLVGSFTDGIETLNAMRKLKPDLAIVDIKMPWMSGLEVLREIRKENREMKIILLSFYSSEYYRLQAIRYGADFFFSKADEFETVLLTVGEILKNERKL